MYYSSPLQVRPGDIIKYSQIYHRPDLHITRKGHIPITDEDIAAMKKFFATGEKSK